MPSPSSLDFYKEAAEQALPTVTDEIANDATRTLGFGYFLGSIMSGVMVVAALLLLLYLIWGAIEWITAGGDKSKVEKARNRMTQAIIGIIVLAATTALFMLVQQFLGLNVLNFESSSVHQTPKAPPARSPRTP